MTELKFKRFVMSWFIIICMIGIVGIAGKAQVIMSKKPATKSAVVEELPAFKKMVEIELTEAELMISE